ncbi:VOC family protein [Streptomyces chrestomyceticus]|uniref:VOC family protein n=1 Tax=Streptomyces chrestomyceticus TaxID=68185 RepID=UPI0033D19617
MTALARVQCIALDCPDPMRLARFYAELLGGEINRPTSLWTTDDDWTTLHTESGTVLAFQRAPGHRPPRWPDPESPQQSHLDLGVHDLEAAHRQVLAAGGTLLDATHGDGPHGFRVYADPAGHPFCLVRERPGDDRAHGKSTA